MNLLKNIASNLIKENHLGFRITKPMPPINTEPTIVAKTETPNSLPSSL
jgi:hypothetical protein